MTASIFFILAALSYLHLKALIFFILEASINLHFNSFNRTPFYQLLNKLHLSSFLIM